MREEKVSVEERKYEEIQDEPLDLRIVRSCDKEVIDKQEQKREEIRVNEEIVLGGEGEKVLKRPSSCEEGSDSGSKRLRGSTTEYKKEQYESSSSETESDDSDSDSEEERIAAREKRFTEILGEMVRKTGEIVGGQVLENAKLINKLQKSVDMMRKEIAELREERRSERRRAGEGEKENRVETEKNSERCTQNGKREERKRLEESSGRRGDFYRGNQRQLCSESNDGKRGWRRERLHYH
ncbi:uncharacterized protein LOC132735291 [Ruditapes philippinarum]|uniref:uncharacterized protein LOC132735291 n=1 Tax=Ruditapes philippinarum TaxID=129788 RepID=UPI00295B82A8|nr:uncharacterized protein LOC132735291 [Ruditapes philippinarum]